MYKILVFLEVPSISGRYEIKIPVHLTIREMSELLIKAVQEISGEAFFPSKPSIICIKEHNSVLPDELTISELGIKNGDHLILI